MAHRRATAHALPSIDSLPRRAPRCVSRAGRLPDLMEGTGSEVTSSCLSQWQSLADGTAVREHEQVVDRRSQALVTCAMLTAKSLHGAALQVAEGSNGGVGYAWAAPHWKQGARGVARAAVDVCTVMHSRVEPSQPRHTHPPCSGAGFRTRDTSERWSPRAHVRGQRLWVLAGVARDAVDVARA